MTILICVADKMILAKLKKEIFTYFDVRKQSNNIVVTFENFESLLNYYIGNSHADLVFIDLIIGEQSAASVAKQMRGYNENILIILMSDSSEYAIKGYDIGAFHFLVKPYTYRTLEQILERATSKILKYQRDCILEKNDRGTYKVYFDSIIYIETYNRNTLIHTLNGSILSYRSMRQHMNSFEHSFCRVHESFIVNLGFVDKVDHYCLTLRNGVNVPISKNRKKFLMESLIGFYGNMQTLTKI